MSARAGRVVEVHEDAAELARAAARRFIETARESIDARGVFTVALAGGSTPKALYALLAAEAAAIDWKRVEVYFGDERCVGPGHADSNYRAAHESLLSRVPVDPSRVHRMPGELGGARGAEAYEQVLRRRFGDAGPALDLILLGMGSDGHTLSLFPGHDFDADAARWCVPGRAPPTASTVDRITLTLSAAARARAAWFLVAGSDKAEVLSRVLASGPDGTRELPASLVRCRSPVEWMVDGAAARLITPPAA